MKTPFAYDWGIALYTLAIHLAAVFSPKARRWVQGRHHWAPDLSQAMAAKFPIDARRIWIHCASLGEFEQGRPLIERLRQTYPEARILLSFFSPSGYDIRRDYPLVDHVCYLPADTRAAASRFLDIVRPDMAVFVKYEFWLRFLSGLFERGVPTLLISAKFRPGQAFFRWYGRSGLEALRRFRYIFVQDAASAALLKAHGVPQCTVAGDTRVDRVAEMAAEGRRIPIAEAFAGTSPVLIAGSTWPPDEELLTVFCRESLPPEWKIIVAPHHVSEPALRRLENALPLPSVRFSMAVPESIATARVLLIDNIGMLSALYRYGQIAYIGGGFGAGIHNTLEPMAFGLPVLFGPKYGKFQEAVEMVKAGGAIAVKHAAALSAAFRHYASEQGKMQALQATRQYLMDNKGATAQIMDFIEKEKWKDEPARII